MNWEWGWAHSDHTPFYMHAHFYLFIEICDDILTFFFFWGGSIYVKLLLPEKVNVCGPQKVLKYLIKKLNVDGVIATLQQMMQMPRIQNLLGLMTTSSQLPSFQISSTSISEHSWGVAGLGSLPAIKAIWLLIKGTKSFWERCLEKKIPFRICCPSFGHCPLELQSCAPKVHSG